MRFRLESTRPIRKLSLLLACVVFMCAMLLCTACASTDQNQKKQAEEQAKDTSQYLKVIEDEPDTVDFQCTTIYYTIATNVFNRLVEMETDADGNAVAVPSLAESWEESEDGRTYTFHLREGVTFSNGSALTSSDVRYTLTRLLTHPDSCNQDVAKNILGASKLESGESAELQGFEELSDLDFSLTLEEPFEAFLACLSMPGASILDEETTQEAGDRFGKEAAATIGTGSFVLDEWVPGEGMLLKANASCWQGAPNCAGVRMYFLTEPEEIRTLFVNGELDILDLDDLGSSAEFFVHGDIYQSRMHEVPRIAITYVALNESKSPLADVRVRKALQLALDRQSLLDAVYSGRGAVENGIYPHGLYGYNPELPEIPYDPAQARELLREAGYENGFDLAFSVKSSSTQWEMTLNELVVSMWEDVGVHATIRVLDEEEFMASRKSGDLACYSAMWTADFNDPDNFVYTFFGSSENSVFRSLCYTNKDAMERVRKARAITDPMVRLQEYQDLERIIVQDDAAWIPLFSRKHLYVTSERLEGFTYMWNGSVKNAYREMTVDATS